MHILIVDDEKKIADVLAERMGLRGHEAVPVYDGESGLERLDTERFDGVVLDLRLPGISGETVLRDIGERHPGLPVIVISGHANQDEFDNCVKLGAVACFQKPADIGKILEIFNQFKKGV